MLEERRNNDRTAINCAMSVTIGDIHLEGTTRNISTGGVLAEITAGDADKVPEGSSADLIVDYHGRELACHCTVLRIASRAIAIAFLEPQFEQVMLIKRIIEENS